MSKTSHALTVVLTSTALVATALAAPASAARPRFTPGAPGTGDPYFPDMGNGGYDVAHYDVDLAFDPATGAISATTAVRATARQDLSRFNLDFQGPLAVRSVQVDGRPAGFARAGAQELVITPSSGLRRGHRFTVRVRYSGVPERVDDPALGLSGWVATDDGAVALNQPFGAATWMPVNDTPADKASYSVALTVPDGLTALGNGDFAGRRSRGGRTTWHWETRQPMASELAMVAIGKYNVTWGRTALGVPNITAIDVNLDTAPGQGAAFAKGTADTVDWGSGVFGRYPFGSTGGIVDAAGVGYALETQTRPVYDRRGRPGVNPSAGLLAHELAHQWFGDSVTPRYWKDIWLNEGFATYAEWLRSEQTGGDTAQQAFEETYATPAGEDLWKPVMADPGRDNIFHETVYSRGAMTLHVLRTAIGDRKFFQLVRLWAARHRYGNVTTADFIRDSEHVAGRQLDGLFAKWAFTSGKPSL